MAHPSPEYSIFLSIDHSMSRPKYVGSAGRKRGKGFPDIIILD